MGETIYKRIQESVEEKKKNLDTWATSASEADKNRCLDCDTLEPIDQHLHVLEETSMAAGNETLGVCEVCHGHVDDSQLEIDYTSNICLDCLSDDQRRHLEAELEFSSQIQRALLPQQAPDIQGLEIGAFSRPAQFIGGDYFDFIDFKSGEHGLAIADVMGHGVSASLMMSSLQTSLQTLIPETDEVPEVIQKINRYYLHNVNLTTFVTVFLAQFDASHGVMTYCNAGHNPPLVYRRNPNGGSQTVWLKPTGAAVGLVEEYKLRSEQVLMDEGDMIVLYTDGLVEATNQAGEAFGNERLVELIRRNADRSAQETISAIRADLGEFAGQNPLADDVTVVICKVSV